jgi:hypothetical protein
MNKTVEIVLTAIVLAGMYCAIPKSSAPVGGPLDRAEQAVLVADGSDPIPFRRSVRK